MPRNRTLGFIACTIASALWGCGFFFGKIALAEMNVGAMVFYRFAFAAIILLPLLLTNKQNFTRREWVLLLTSAFLGVPVQFLLQFYGLSLTTVSHASLMVGTLPVLLAVGAAIYAHERTDRIGWLALAGSTLGAALIALGKHAVGAGQPTLLGDCLVIVSLCIALVWILLNQKLLSRHSAVVVSSYGLISGTAMLALVAPILYGLPPIHHISWKAWSALAASGILCTATTTLLWNWGLTQVPASQAGVLLNMEPLVGSLLGVIVLGESLGPSAWLGGTLILTAAVILTTHSKTQVRPPIYPE